MAIPTALGSTAPVVYVAADGSGDYNCDGTADEVQINQATAFVNANPEYDTVYIKAGNYEIADTVVFYSDMTLRGAGPDKTIIRLVDESMFPKYQSLFEPNTRAAHNFKIHDFQIDGNYFSQSYVRTVFGEPAVHGRSYMDGIGFRHNSPNGDLSDPYDFEIFNMEIHHAANDGIKINGDGKPANMRIYNNEFYWTGHDDIYIHGADGVYIYDNYISVLNGDCGFRVENTDNVVITNNVLQTDPSALHGLSGIYLSLTGSSYTSQNYEVSYNEIKTHQEFGIVVCNRVEGTPPLDQASNLNIHHNLIYDSTGYGSYSGGIQINGWHNTVIENNLIDTSEGDGIITRNRFGMGDTTGYKIYIRDNFIGGTTYNSGFTASGYGINNYLASSHDLILENNNVWDNEKGNYRNVGSASTDSNVDPLFVDRANHDYRLRSDSPLLNAGIGPYADGDFTPTTPPAPSNTAPVLSSIGTKSINEGGALSFVVTASDADGDSLMYSASGLPAGATFNGASRTFSWTPDVGQEGTYGVTFDVTDGELTDSEVVSIIVSPEGSSGNVLSSMYVNRLRESTPDAVITADGYVDVGSIAGVGSYRDIMWFDLSDYDQTDTVTSATLSLTWYYPENAPRNQDTVVEVYRAADWEHSEVSWNEKSAGRSWNNAGGDWFDETGVAQGSVPYASITFSGSDLPDNGKYEFDVTELVQDYVSGEYANTGFFIKARNENDNYIAFYGTDFLTTNQGPKLNVVTSSTEPVGNVAPVMNPIGSKTVDEGSALNFILSASDADGDILTYSATGLPVGATFDAAFGAFSWTPDVGQDGTYAVTFEVTDGQLVDSETVSMTVSSDTSTTNKLESMYVNRLREASPDSTLPGDQYIDVGNNALGSYREVMLFDLSKYNETDTISSATLSLTWYYPNAPRDQDTVVEIYRASDWDPAQVSWNEKSSGIPWTNAGGDWFDKTGAAQGSMPYASMTFSASDLSDNGVYELDVTELVQEYVSGEHANTGFFIKARDENGNYIAFYGTGSSNANQQPKLTVTHSMNTGSDTTVPTMTVGDISPSVTQNGINYEVLATVQILDESNKLVTGATVNGYFTLNTEVISTVSGTTGVTGEARIDSGRFKAKGGDTVTFTVTGVDHPDYSYEPGTTSFTVSI